MDCEKLVSMVKRWGYTSHQYLVDVYGMTQKEAEECIKGVGIDLGYCALPVEWPGVSRRLSNSPFFV
jgi:hypothetical protein